MFGSIRQVVLHVTAVLAVLVVIISIAHALPQQGSKDYPLNSEATGAGTEYRAITTGRFDDSENTLGLSAEERGWWSRVRDRVVKPALPAVISGLVRG